MKSLEYMVAVAMGIARYDENAEVVFFVGPQDLLNQAWQMAKDEAHGRKFVMVDEFAKIVRWEKAGRIRFAQLNMSTVDNYAGSIITHAFYTGVDLHCLPYVKRRVRSHHKHVAPIGLYGPHGAEIYQDY